MPLFLSVKNNRAVIPTFNEKGIPDQMPGAAGDVPVVAFSEVAMVYQCLSLTNTN